MYCLTIDVHHMALKGVDQRFLRSSETFVGRKFLDIADDLGVKSTMFLSGRCVEEHARDVLEFMSYPLLEIGGHNYSCFQPLAFYQIYERISGLKNGPYSLQERDVIKTIRLLEGMTGERVLSWRNHGFRGDRNTSEILSRHGVKFRSDLVDLGCMSPFHDGHLIVVPINTLPDHDHVHHGSKVERFIDRRKSFRNLIRKRFVRNLSIDDWMNDILRRTERICNEGGVATLLMHPACMSVIDNFATARVLLTALRAEFGTGVFVRDTESRK